MKNLKRSVSHFFSVVLIVLLLSSCADSKDFIIDGETVTIEPYGWFDLDAKNENIHYKVNVDNVVWSVVLAETVIAPILITGNQLYEPEYKIQPK